MKAGEARDCLFEQLGTILSPLGFTLRKKEGEFRRGIPEGRQAIGVAIFNYNPRFDFALTICIRLDKVEELFSKFAGGDPNADELGYTTLTGLSYFAPEFPERFQFLTAQDIVSAVARIRPVVTDRIIPFLDRTQDMAALAESMKCKPSLDQTIQPYAAMHAVIVGFLNRGSDLEALAEHHRSQLKSLPPDFQRKFEELVKHLSTLGKSEDL